MILWENIKGLTQLGILEMIKTRFHKLLVLKKEWHVTKHTEVIIIKLEMYANGMS